MFTEKQTRHRQEAFASSCVLPFLNFGFPKRKQFYFWRV